MGALPVITREKLDGIATVAEVAPTICGMEVARKVTGERGGGSLSPSA
ncbi:MAG: hypothetical protein IPM54_35070 [Polyangiaceae bacterium]|nr:hypothetical protein [Polyangiaceae bacterium]